MGDVFPVEFGHFADVIAGLEFRKVLHVYREVVLEVDDRWDNGQILGKLQVVISRDFVVLEIPIWGFTWSSFEFPHVEVEFGQVFAIIKVLGVVKWGDEDGKKILILVGWLWLTVAEFVILF